MNLNQTTGSLTTLTAKRWFAFFAILWGLAILFHLFSDFQNHYAWLTLAPVPLLSFFLGLSALVVIATRRPAPLVVMAVLQLAVFWLAFPAVSNHWIVAAMINLAILAAMSVARTESGGFDPARFWRWFAPTGRWILLAFYSFAALAKWNSDFFNPAVSCAVLLGEISASSFGLGFLFGFPLVQWAAILGTWAIESSIPVLLFFRRTRVAGVILGIAFHFALAADFMRHFYDFSSLLTALFVLFLPGGFADWVFGQVYSRISVERRVFLHRLALGTLTFLMIAPGLGIELLQIVAFLANQIIWYLYGGLMAWLAWRYGRQANFAGTAGQFRLAHPLLALLPVLMVVNGLLGYGEVRRGRAFDMYSNLRTVAGETNHWLLPAVSLSAAQSNPIVILEAAEKDLEPYIASDVAVSFLALRKYLSARPDTPITLAYQNEIIALERAGDWPEVVAPLPWWQRKFLTFKPLDLRPANRCFDEIWALD